MSFDDVKIGVNLNESRAMNARSRGSCRFE